MPARTLDEKADAILAEGRLLVETVTGSGATALIVASCLSSDRTNVYRLGHDPRNDQWRCTCFVPGRRPCSHLVALRRVTDRTVVLSS